MIDNSKTHAKDYLIDFYKNQSPWLKLLILEVINTNGNISKSKLDDIYSCLKKNKKTLLPSLSPSSTSNKQKIIFKKLEHISGVNALASNQTITFGDNVTVLYGLNGAGKSSYFKVLNEIVGGNEQKEILSNIHKDQPESIQVKLTYEKGNDHEICFNNSERGYEPLTRCKVFDSSYLAGLLSQRTQNDAILEPLGLHLFKYIAEKIDEFKMRLKEDADKLRNTKPFISSENFSDELKGEFDAHNLSEHSIGFLKDRFVFSDESKAISDQKTEIEKWIRIDKEENDLRQIETAINTTKITLLSNEAHDELLTAALDKAFRDELNQLVYNNLEVNLVKAKGDKGSNSTKLILKSRDSIHSILSEGEQKAVGLALFIAEASIQKSQSPIILDDPVNSLDHRIAANFANRLLSLENQLVIFNHNRLFQDAFETVKSGHICKTIDSNCNKQGKHILVYYVSSEEKSRKGVISFYKTNNFKNHIDTIKNELKKSPFTEHSKVSTLLRKAAECLIDETVLKGVIPIKYSNKNNRIPWDNLKKLKCSPEDIEKIRKVHDRVSGGNLHNGTESENNPIDVNEFNKLVVDLESVTGGSSHD